MNANREYLQLTSAYNVALAVSRGLPVEGKYSSHPETDWQPLNEVFARFDESEYIPAISRLQAEGVLFRAEKLVLVYDPAPLGTVDHLPVPHYGAGTVEPRARKEPLLTDRQVAAMTAIIAVIIGILIFGPVIVAG